MSNIDFDDINVAKFVQASLPDRFLAIDPYAFEGFMAHYFRQHDYEVTETKLTGDFGADLIIAKNGQTTAVQIKRYHATNKVGVKDINQVIAGKTYFSTDHALMVTTSDYTASAKELANQSNVFCWSWEQLQRRLIDTFLANEEQPQIGSTAENISLQDELSFEISEIEYGLTVGQEEITLVRTQLSNLSDQNWHLFIELPTLIRSDKMQFKPIDWWSDSFVNGPIFPEAKVEVNFYFLARQLDRDDDIEQLLLSVHIPSKASNVTLTTSPEETTDSRCFIVTFSAGRQSKEYQFFTTWRDEFLLSSKMGKNFVQCYYSVSPLIVRILNKLPFGRSIGRILIRILYSFLRK